MPLLNFHWIVFIADDENEYKTVLKIHFIREKLEQKVEPPLSDCCTLINVKLHIYTYIPIPYLNMT